MTLDSQSSSFIPNKKDPSKNKAEGFMNPRTGLDVAEEAKIFCPCKESNLSCKAYSQTYY
jgi:hypothetical protein